MEVSRKYLCAGRRNFKALFAIPYMNSDFSKYALQRVSGFDANQYFVKYIKSMISVNISEIRPEGLPGEG